MNYRLGIFECEKFEKNAYYELYVKHSGHKAEASMHNLPLIRDVLVLDETI